ncbi:MAG TPA: signal peptidase I [Limnochordia bacterium]|nr:signal peptidase I [Limnochordia bacterium]
MAQPKSEVREYVEALLIAVVLALVIITFVAQSYVVDGPSMEPTLHNGERLLVDKLTYRFRAPERGEIIIFRYPADPSRRFVNRVIGVPVDTIAVHDQHVWLNGVELSEPYPKEATYGVFPNCSPTGDCPPEKIEPGHFFVMGDNRNNSEDSRFPDVGQVPRKLVVGRAVIRYWPPTRLGLFHRPADVYQKAVAQTGG